MKRILLCLLVLVAVPLMSATARAERRAPLGGIANRVGMRHARGMSWHTPYYHTATGVPVALVVPPTANMQVQWGWGVAQSSMRPIYHQFNRAYPGEVYYGENQFRPTPQWPSHTNQFGVNYVRGPW